MLAIKRINSTKHLNISFFKIVSSVYIKYLYTVTKYMLIVYRVVYTNKLVKYINVLFF